MTSPWRMVGALFVVTAVSAAALSAVYRATEEPRRRIKAAEEERLRREVLPSAERFKSVRRGGAEFFEGYDGKGSLVGFVAKGTARGYGGDVVVLVGLDRDLRVVAVRVLEQKETPGLGTRATEPPFLRQFRGLKAEDLKLKRYGGKIDAITGATITSRAVTEAAREAAESVARALGRDGG